MNFNAAARGILFALPLLATPQIASAAEIKVLSSNAAQAMLKDADFRADAARQKLDLSPASWRDLEKTVAEAFEATPKQIEIARKYYQ